MADGGGFWGIVVLVAIMLFSLYLFFEVFGFQPKATGT